MGNRALLAEVARRTSLVETFTGVAVGLGVAAVVAAADRADAPASSPIEPPGAWRWVLLAGAAVAFSAYVAGVVLLRRRVASVAVVATVAVCVQLVPLAGPTLLSTDAWTYWMYGRIAAELDGNPYADKPSRYSSDPAYAVMGGSWRETTSIYGPVFTLTSEGTAKLAGAEPDRAAWLFRLTAALSILGAAAIAGALAANTAFAVAFVGWNPLLALHLAGGGHNDALMMLLVLGALLLAARSRVDLAGVAWVAAVAVKWVAAAFLALWLLYRWRRRLPLGLVGLAIGGTGVAALATARYGWEWPSAVRSASEQARRTGSLGLSHWLGELGLGHRPKLVVIALLLFVALAWLARAAWSGRLRLGLAGSALALGQGWLNPWYGSWGATLAAPERDTAAHAVAILLSGFLLLDALPL